ncbi:tRNA(1)(Val) (adenine(37)-N(6))-methyltransferase TrmN [Pectobacterium wasabiae]|uniref:tRNA1(Val) (adenine(37)-N6)-methyltransferase n=1 Tax=Pectobacterium wasabiae TaxID=55208 RepID=A0AAW3EBT5_9GAMM|nr:tRNA1(Val) (adenine(37)-N6)-methyltransferase [Pectobacterium wasabiae]AOR62123.1 SAM-dependent methyltransferase [Pectobacterium wasabiae CFBP 3304]EJS93558.1 TRNA1(Val) (adenine(37)-N6)-methyltransferase [Pectobacterium wasabiae CFBP 3304]KFX02829.1 SAM-dependent methlyltransferase [Pectobacterium wasabiae]KGA26426.1 SAM-dependent methlyltransferase [Pectobacterium wasabiae]
MSHQADNKLTLRRDGFTFKQFFVAHDRCAMKVGTDGILLGAWAPVSSDMRILDIGSGSGLLALMLAQRSEQHVQIDAVELDSAASQQAKENIAASPWADRITVYAEDIVGFTATRSTDYSLIISNPPYFPPGIACGSAQREQARYTTLLTHDVLLCCAHQLLMPEGLFCVVLPVQVAEHFIPLAQQHNWHVQQQLCVSEQEERPVHRVLLTLSRQERGCVNSSLVIRDAERRYSMDFQQLTKDFYLFM